MHAALFELMRGDQLAPQTTSPNSPVSSREHDLPLLRAFGEFLGGWATANAARLREELTACAAASTATRAELLTLTGC